MRLFATLSLRRSRCGAFGKVYAATVLLTLSASAALPADKVPMTGAQLKELLGGGLSVGVPTGSEVKGIGSSHIVELEPFLDAAYKRHELELVTFARFSSTVHRRANEEAERNLAFDFSALYRIHPRLETLLELTTERSLVASDVGAPQTFIAPGLKMYPLSNKQIMFGASLELGTGAARHQQSILVSGFYHF